MYARTIRFMYRPGTLDQAVDMLRGSVIPALTELPGYQGHTNLVNHDNGKVIGITYWDTKENCDASGATITDPQMQERVAQVAQFFAEPPQVEVFEVSDHNLPTKVAPLTV